MTLSNLVGDTLVIPGQAIGCAADCLSTKLNLSAVLAVTASHAAILLWCCCTKIHLMVRVTPGFFTQESP